MEDRINPLVKDIQISGIRQFFNMIAGIPDVISFTIGQPDFNTPEHIKTTAVGAITGNHTTYTMNAGLLELRKAACVYFEKKYNLNYLADSEIIVTAGASEAIDVALRTILQPGDEVLLPCPIYPGYEPIIQICGAKAVYLDTRETAFKVTATQIRNKISEKTKCIILPYPSNPTGVSLSQSELEEIAVVLGDHKIFVLADEIYSELADNHFSIANLLKEQTIVINGLSKSHAMTGWRIGFLLAPATICQHMLKVHQYNVTCASSISQHAALAALTTGFDDALPMRTAYRERRKYVYDRLTKMGLETTFPDGAFYFFVKLPVQCKQSSWDFALELVKKAGVAVVPGSAFTQYGEGFFRVSYACAMETLIEGLNRMERYFAERNW